MPDIDPAALSRPSVSLSTPTLKSITVSAPTSQKVAKSQIIPARIDLETLYTPLKAAIGNEQWNTYKDTVYQFILGTSFVPRCPYSYSPTPLPLSFLTLLTYISHTSIGRLNQAEYSERIDPILTGPSPPNANVNASVNANGDKVHLHNQFVAAIYGNLTREMPDQGVAPWVSANDKPTTNVGAKPVTGDAAERRLKGEVMQLPSRDRRRIKESAQNQNQIDVSISLIARVVFHT